jgi:glycerate 2-kinase
LELAGMSEVLLFSPGTDGSNGETDAAGARADGDTCARVRKAGISLRGHSEESDAYPLFAGRGDLVGTGPSRTNVMAIHLVLVK